MSAETDNSNEVRRVTMRGVVLYVGIACLILNTLALWGFGSSHGEMYAYTEAEENSSGNIMLAPFARHREPLEIVVSSDDSWCRFEPISFTGIPFDHGSIAEGQHIAHRLLNLSMCYSKNCSCRIRIDWRVRQQRFFDDRVSLVSFFPLKRTSSDRNHGGDGKVDAQNIDYEPHFQQSLALSPVVDFTAPLPQQYQAFTPIIDERTYGPAVYVNNFWVLREHLVAINETSILPLTVSVTPIAAWKVVMHAMLDDALHQQMSMGLNTQENIEETKRIFCETNPYFLALTGAVTLLHMVFEYLAFSNDVSFWRGRKDFKGLSLRSVVMNCYFQTVIFLYLCESGETSWTILLPSALGVLTEFWKLTQTVSLSRVSACDICDERVPRCTGKCVIWGYEIRFQQSYDKQTQRLDRAAMKYLLIAMTPILLGYCVYSALNNTHANWYSYAIHTQVQFIYLFGFVMMTPQIFINYQLKSVGQLPWRSFVYKALNTVIDDLFAFIIKMPWLHRLACFRDDVVFAILLYQRWIYPVDDSRGADDEGGLDLSCEDTDGTVHLVTTQKKEE